MPKEDKEESTTVIVEHGTFKREYRRKGKNSKTKLIRYTKNPEKVVLCKIGELEVYVYPFNYPDKVFFGKYPHFTMQMNEHEITDLFRAYNRIRWYFEHAFDPIKEPQKTAKNEKQANRTRLSIRKSYNHALNKLPRPE
jgi:hypothetical protein